MFSELVKTVKVQLYERITSPLFSTFFLAWCVWNYRFVLLIFDKSTFENKILIIDGVLYPTVYHYIGFNFLLPLLTALAMIYLYPIPAKRVFEHWRTQQLELKKIQQRIEDETPMTIEESRAIRQEALKVELDFHAQLKKKDEEIADLKKIILEMTESKESSGHSKSDNILNVQPITKTSANIPDNTNAITLDTFTLNERHIAENILFRIGTHHTPDLAALKHLANVDELMLLHILDKLIDGGLIECYYSEDYGDNVYRLTKHGRSIIVKTEVYQEAVANKQ